MEAEKMAGIKELIRSEADGSLSFGNHTLSTKTKRADFNHKGDIYKVKTFNEITRLEKNDAFVYESTPGTTVYNFEVTDDGASFSAEADGDVQVTLDLKEDTIYRVIVDGDTVGSLDTNISGKLTFGLKLDKGAVADVIIKQA